MKLLKISIALIPLLLSLLIPGLISAQTCSLGCDSNPTAIPTLALPPTATPAPTITPTATLTNKWGDIEAYQTPFSIATPIAISTPVLATPSPITASEVITVMQGISVSFEDILTRSGAVISNLLISTLIISDLMEPPTETFTVLEAPPDYVPQLPRPLADAGYTMQIQGESMLNGEWTIFTLASWTSFFGFLISLPFAILKSVVAIATVFKPLALFIGWLFFIAPFIIFTDFIIWLTSTIKWLFNTAVSVISFAMQVVQLIFIIIEASDNILIIGGALTAFLSLCAICSI